MAMRELAPWRGAHAEVERSLGESGWARGSSGEVWIAGWGDIDMGEVGKDMGEVGWPWGTSGRREEVGKATVRLRALPEPPRA